MKKDPPKNLAASVRQRLMNLARAQGDPFQTVLTRYALERLLYRLSQSRHADRFVLKGALLFSLWSETPHRATRDLDLLGFGNPSGGTLVDIFRSLCLLEVIEDGLCFLGDTVRAETIREDHIYGGVRVTLTARLENARIPVQVDVGFGDAITPEPGVADFPTLLAFPAPRLRVYARETMIAEKLQAIVVLGLGNSRMKDYFDLYVLGQQFAFDGPRLGATLAATLARRETPPLVAPPVGLTLAFAEAPQKQTQWRAFARRQPDVDALPSLADTVAFLAQFLRPVLESVSAGRPLQGQWPPGGPWQRTSHPPQPKETTP